MKICLDLRTASNGRHGIARYGTELAKALQALDTSHRLILLTRQGNEFEGLRQAGASVHSCSARPYSLEEQLLVPLTVARLRPDIYHCLTYACPLFVPCPTLFNIYDLLPLERPQEFSRGLRLYYRGFVRWTVWRAQRIVTASSYTSSSICEEKPCELEAHGQTLFSLARALAAKRGDKGSTSKLARRIHEIFGTTPKRLKAKMEKDDSWLGEHDDQDKSDTPFRATVAKPEKPSTE